MIVNADRRGVCSAAVHDAMTNGFKPVPALMRKPGEELTQKLLVAEVGPAFLKSFVDDRVATRLPRRQMRGDPNLLDLPAENLPQLRAGLCLPQGELKTRRSGIRVKMSLAMATRLARSLCFAARQSPLRPVVL